MTNKELELKTEAPLPVFQPPTSFEVVDRGAAESVTFKEFGDTFIGIYEYSENIEDVDKKTGEIDRYTHALFTGEDGKPYCIFPGASLERALRRVPTGSWVRITYERDVQTGQPSPMKSFIVEVARP